MTNEGLSPGVREFINKYIDSVEQLEILILLFMSHPKSWTCSEITDRILSSTSSVSQRLEQLKQNNLIEVNGDQCSWKSDPKLDQDLREVIEMYKTKRIRIIELIFSKPTDRLRDFSDAFKFRKD